MSVNNFILLSIFEGHNNKANNYLSIKESIMDTLTCIKTRRSIRKYKQTTIDLRLIEELIEAGMYAPSARNQQCGHYIIFKDKEQMRSIMQIHPNASMLDSASVAILVCADERLEIAKGYYPVDCAASTQNILLAAHAKGLGAVWLGVYPRVDRMLSLQNIFQLPDNIKPFSLISIGYPDEEKDMPERFKKERIHYDKW